MSDSSRISVTAHYTAYTWYEHGLSAAPFVTPTGRLSYAALKPINSWLRERSGLDLESMLLQRHSMIDERISHYIENEGITQIVEFGAGLSPRGWRMMQKYEHLGLRYIEADLPKMATRKRRLLEKHDMRIRGHKVMQCDLLARQGYNTVEHIIGGELDLNRPAIFITEGVVNYFPLPLISGVWRRFAVLMRKQHGGVYLSDLIQKNASHGAANWLQRGQRLIGMVARGPVPLHFNDDEQTQKAFLDYGFDLCHVHNPKEFVNVIPQHAQTENPIVRVIEAVVERA